MFGQTLADFQLTQAKLGEMAALIDAGALLTYRAAWMRDTGQGSQKERSVAAAMAKMTATENAQRVIDMALQMHGGLGVMVGSKVESLYRDIRSLRIYEGATEVQQLIIGKAVLQEAQHEHAIRTNRLLRARPPAAARAVARVSLRPARVADSRPGQRGHRAVRRRARQGWATA
jgi:phage FluMu gp28-like protein